MENNNRVGQPLGNQNFPLDTTLRLGPPDPNMNNHPQNPATNNPGRLNVGENGHTNFGNLDHNYNGGGQGRRAEAPHQHWFGLQNAQNQYLDNTNELFYNTRQGINNAWRRNNLVLRICGRCGTIQTPMWRRGPDGPQTLCNACGLWYSRMQRNAGQNARE